MADTLRKSKCMNQYEAVAELADEFPELKKELSHVSILGNAHQAMHLLLHHTREMIRKRNFAQVSKCMRLAERIHARGNSALKNAVENTYVYSFSMLQAQCNRTEWRIVKAGMPIVLFSIYIRQIIQSH